MLPELVPDNAARNSAATCTGIVLSERFVQRWKQAKLKGLDFILAWDSDLPPEAQPNVWLHGQK